jgi:hypothetical protein
MNFLHSVSGYPFVTGAVIYPGRWTVAKLKVSVAIDLYEKHAVQILAGLLTIMTAVILSSYSSVSSNRSRLQSKFLHTVHYNFTLYNLCSWVTSLNDGRLNHFLSDVYCHRGGGGAFWVYRLLWRWNCRVSTDPSASFSIVMLNKVNHSCGAIYCLFFHLDSHKKNSMVWVRERTIPTERPLLVGEVIANFCG